MGLLDYFTKEGRKEIAQRQEQKRKLREESERLKQRKEFERTQKDLPRYAQAHRWFEDYSHRYYDCAERRRLDVMYLNMMMQAIDAGEKATKWYGQEVPDPLGYFHWRYFDFVNLYFAHSKDYQYVQATAFEDEYKFVSMNDVESIILWAKDHGDDCARMFLYELRVRQHRIEEATEIRWEAEYFKQTPWFWKKIDSQNDAKQYLSERKSESVASRWTNVKTGEDFEKFILWRLKSKNIMCDQIGGSGDQGVDIVVYGERHKVAIQCKFYSHPVDNAAVQQVFAGMKYHGCTNALVVSNAEYTPGAIDLARKIGVELCSYLDILEILELWMKK